MKAKLEVSSNMQNGFLSQKSKLEKKPTPKENEQEIQVLVDELKGEISFQDYIRPHKSKGDPQCQVMYTNKLLAKCAQFGFTDEAKEILERNHLPIGANDIDRGQYQRYCAVLKIDVRNSI